LGGGGEKRLAKKEHCVLQSGGRGKSDRQRFFFRSLKSKREREKTPRKVVFGEEEGVLVFCGASCRITTDKEKDPLIKEGKKTIQGKVNFVKRKIDLAHQKRGGGAALEVPKCIDWEYRTTRSRRKGKKNDIGCVIQSGKKETT